MAIAAQPVWRPGHVAVLLVFALVGAFLLVAVNVLPAWFVLLVAVAGFAGSLWPNAHLGPLRGGKLHATTFMIMLLAPIVLAISAAKTFEREQSARLVELHKLERRNPAAAARALRNEETYVIDALVSQGSGTAMGEQRRRAQVAARMRLVSDRAAEKANAVAITSAKRELAGLIPEQGEERLAVYRRLQQLAPANDEYRHAAQKIVDHLADIQNRIDHPEANIELLRSKWSKGGLGNIFILDATLKNTGTRAWKDFGVFCQVKGASGTVIGSVRRTIYESLEPGERRRFRNVTMGLIDDAAAEASCEIASAAPN